MPLDGLEERVQTALDEIQALLLATARDRREANTFRGVDKDQLIEIMDGSGGFAFGGYCGSEACEMAIQERTKATTRVLPDEEFRSSPAPATCAWCGRPASVEAVWAKAY